MLPLVNSSWLFVLPRRTFRQANLLHVWNFFFLLRGANSMLLYAYCLFGNYPRIWLNGNSSRLFFSIPVVTGGASRLEPFGAISHIIIMYDINQQARIGSQLSCRFKQDSIYNLKRTLNKEFQSAEYQCKQQTRKICRFLKRTSLRIPSE